jgi:hypothetical protein
MLTDDSRLGAIVTLNPDAQFEGANLWPHNDPKLSGQGLRALTTEDSTSDVAEQARPTQATHALVPLQRLVNAPPVPSGYAARARACRIS